MNESILLHGFVGNYAHARYELYKAGAKDQMLVNISRHVFEIFAQIQPICVGVSML